MGPPVSPTAPGLRGSCPPLCPPLIRAGTCLLPKTHVKPRAFVLQKYSVLYLFCGRKITWPGPQSFLARARGEVGGGGWGGRGFCSPQTTRTARPPSLGALAPCLPRAAPAPEGDAEVGSRRGSHILGGPEDETRSGRGPHCSGAERQEGLGGEPQATPDPPPRAQAWCTHTPPGNGATG